jgi:hypothetical protein
MFPRLTGYANRHLSGILFPHQRFSTLLLALDA